MTSAIQKVAPDHKGEAIVMAENSKKWEYSSPSAIQVYNKHFKVTLVSYMQANPKHSCGKIANKIIDNLDDNVKQIIESVVPTQLGKGPVEKSPFYLNFHIKQEYVCQNIHQMLINGTDYKADEQK